MSARTITLPALPASAAWPHFAWPSKDPRDSLPYTIDCSAVLADVGLLLEDVSISSDDGLIVTAPPVFGPPGSNTPATFTVQISGGTPSTCALISFVLTLSSASFFAVNVHLPIRAAVYGLSAVIAPNTTTSTFAAVL